MPYSHASMLILGEGSEATEPYNKYDKIRPHSIRSLQFDQKLRPLSFRPEKFDLFTAIRGTLLLNQLLRNKLLPPDYEICESRELSKSLCNIQNRKKSECLADTVFV